MIAAITMLNRGKASTNDMVASVRLASASDRLALGESTAYAIYALTLSISTSLDA